MENFTAIRNGLLEHLQSAHMGPFDLGVYTLLHLRADWETGVTTTCALTLAYHFGNPSLKPHIQKALRRLRDRKYINYRNGDGKRNAYPILINKYFVTVGEQSGCRLNAWKHGELCLPEYEPQNGDGTVVALSRNSGGTVVAPIQDLRLKDVLQDEEKTRSLAANELHSEPSNAEEALIYARFYFGDYLKDTGDLSLTEHGALVNLWAHYCSTEKPLSIKAEHLYRICRAFEATEQAAVDTVLKRFFVLESDGYHHRDADKLISEYHAYSEEQKAKAEKSWSGKRQRKPEEDEAVTDPRHAATRALIQSEHLAAFKVKCQWDGSEAKALAVLLKGNPSWTQADLGQMVHNRFSSEGVTPARPRTWIPRLSEYLAGPLDRFNKAKTPDKHDLRGIDYAKGLGPQNANGSYSF
jgi:uncharacterized protein YdaU (DUF1376 family)